MSLWHTIRAGAQALLAGASLLMANVGHAQNVAIDVVNYARTAAPTAINAIDLRLDGVRVGADLEYRKGHVLVVPAGVNVTLDVTRAGAAEVLASITATLEVGKRYLLLVSGDGSVQAFRVRLEEERTDGRRFRFFNAAAMAGDANTTRVDLEDADSGTKVDAAHGEVSAALPIALNNQTRLRLRSRVSGSVLVDLRRRGYADLRQPETLLVLVGTPGNLTVDEVQIHAVIIGVTADLPALALGAFDLQFLNGGAYSDRPDPLIFTASGVASSGIVEYGAFSAVFRVPAQGTYRICAYVPIGGAPNSDFGACATLDFSGGERYVAVAKSTTPNTFPAPGANLDPLPFAIYRLSTAAAGSAVVRVHYAAVPPRQRQAVSVRRDDGGNPRALHAPTTTFAGGLLASEPTTVTLLDGPPVRVDIKVSSENGRRNLADLAPITPAAGSSIDAFFIGDGKVYPYRLANLAGIANEDVVDMAVNGLWTIDEVPLEGFNFNPLPAQDRLLGTWYSHGDGNQSWYLLDSCDSDLGALLCARVAAFDNHSVRLRAYTSSGGPQARTVIDSGSIDIEFIDCYQARAMVNLIGQPARTLNLQNQTPSADCN